MPTAADSPRAAALQGFLATPIATKLREAVALLGSVSTDFRAMVHDRGRAVEIDHTDVLLFEAVALGALAVIEVQQAYDLDVDLAGLRASLEGTAPYGISDFAAQNPDFLRLLSSGTLPAARTDAIAALDALKAAAQSLASETDDQADDLVRIVEQQCSYDPATYRYSCTPVYNPSQRIDELVAEVDQVRGVVAAPGVYRFDRGTPADQTDDAVIDPGKFFAGLDVRALAPSRFDAGLGGDRPGLFPDPTFGGLLVTSPVDVNQDRDGDGSPDILGGYTQFGPWLVGTWTYSWAWVGNRPVYGTCAFAPSGNALTWTDQSVSPPAISTGTYAYSGNVLTLTLDAPDANGVKSLLLTAQDLSDPGNFSAQVVYRDATGAVLATTSQYFTLQ